MAMKDVEKTDSKNKSPAKNNPGSVDVELNDPATALVKFGVGVVHETFGLITNIVNSNNQRRIALAQIQAELEKALATIDAELKIKLKEIDDKTKIKIKTIETIDNAFQNQLNNSTYSADMKMSILNSYMGLMKDFYMNA